MRFLVDAQLPRRMTDWFRAGGFDAIHTLDLSFGCKVALLRRWAMRHSLSGRWFLATSGGTSLAHLSKGRISVRRSP